MKKFLPKKRMAGGGKVRIALDAMSKALTVYDVTCGEGSVVWAQDDGNKGLRFIVNGYHAKFQDIVINGAVADKKHY